MEFTTMIAHEMSHPSNKVLKLSKVLNMRLAYEHHGTRLQDIQPTQ
jgi:hypothetical protein